MNSKKSIRKGRIPSPRKKTEQKMYKGNLQKKKKKSNFKGLHQYKAMLKFINK